MPIRPENRWLYPIDWDQLSANVRFRRAGARCEQCGRPHMRRVVHLGDGHWWDSDVGRWRTGRGRPVMLNGYVALSAVRTAKVVLACAHLDHDPGNSAPAISRHCVSAATSFTTRRSIGGNDGGTGFGYVPTVTSSKIPAYRVGD